MDVRFIRPVDGRIAGVHDPKPGQVVTVGNSVGRALVSQRMAVPVAADDVETATVAPDETRSGPVTTDDVRGAAPAAAPEPEGTEVEPEGEPDKTDGNPDEAPTEAPKPVEQPVKRGPGRPRKNG